MRTRLRRSTRRGEELVAGASLDADDTLNLDVSTNQRMFVLAHSEVACSGKHETSRFSEPSFQRGNEPLDVPTNRRILFPGHIERAFRKHETPRRSSDNLECEDLFAVPADDTHRLRLGSEGAIVAHFF